MTGSKIIKLLLALCGFLVIIGLNMVWLDIWDVRQIQGWMGFSNLTPIFLTKPDPGMISKGKDLISSKDQADRSSVFRDRQQSVEHFCRLNSKDEFQWPYLNSSWRPDAGKYNDIYVDDEHGFLYCKIPKAACSNTMRLIFGLRGVEEPYKIPPPKFWPMAMDALGLRHLSPEEARHKLKHYRKFLIVRDPFERLFSAYRSKFGRNGQPEFFKTYGREILRTYHPDWSAERLESGQGVEFHEFLQFILDGGENEHWKSYFNLCFPCEVNYDIIAKFETLDADVDYFLREVEIGEEVRWPSRNDRYKERPSLEVLQEELTKMNVTFDLASKIAKLYKNDYDAFGYSPQKIFDLLPDTE